MLFPVDFSIKINEDFYPVHTELIFANTVSECMKEAREIKKTLPQQDSIHIFIDA